MGVLNEFDRKSHAILLDGEFRRSEASESRDVIDPATEDVIAQIAETTAAEVDAAVEAGHAASKKWWRISALERSEITEVRYLEYAYHHTAFVVAALLLLGASGLLSGTWLRRLP